MKVKLSLRLFMFGIVTFFAVYSDAKQALAVSNSYAYCVLEDSQNSTGYFTPVFPGDPKKKAEYQKKFKAKIESEVVDVFGDPVCYFSPDRSIAHSAHSKRKETARDILDYIIIIEWKP